MSHPLYPPSHACRCEEGAASNFGFHLPVDIDSTQLSFVEERLTPDNGLAGGRSFDFTVEASPDAFLEMNNMVLDVKFKVTKGDNKANLEESDAVVMSRLALSTMFQSIECRLNDQLINPESGQNIPYKAFIETFLSHDASANGQLESRGGVRRIKESLVKTHEYINRRNETVEGAVVNPHPKMKHIRGGKEVQLCGPLCVDFLRVNNHLAPGNKLSLKLNRASDGMIFHCGSVNKNTKLNLQIVDMGLSLRWLHMLPPLTKNLLMGVEKEKYFGAHVVLKNFGVPPNLLQWSQPLIEQGNVLPKHIVVGMKTTRDFQGNRENDTLTFAHFDVNHVALKRDNRTLPSKPLTPDFAKGCYAREYFRLFEQTGKSHSGFQHNLTMEEYANFCPLMVWDMSPDLCNGGAHTHVGALGELKLDLQFAHALPEAITLLVLMSFDQLLTVDRVSREVQYHRF